MKLNRTFLAVMLIALSFTLQSMAQPSGPTALNHLEKVDAIIGMTVTDLQNQRIGRVEELAIDWQAGRIAEVLVDTGGFLTSKRRIVAVPTEFLTTADSGGELRMNADIDAFDSAPAFDISAWMESTTTSMVADVYKRFHSQSDPGAGALVRAGKLMGVVVRNSRNERLARVESMVVALPCGRLPEVILVSAGFFGTRGEVTAVAPQAFYFEPGDNALILDTSKEALKKAMHFKPGDWRNTVNNPINLSPLGDSLQVRR